MNECAYCGTKEGLKKKGDLWVCPDCESKAWVYYGMGMQLDPYKPYSGDAGIWRDEALKLLRELRKTYTEKTEEIKKWRKEADEAWEIAHETQLENKRLKEEIEMKRCEYANSLSAEKDRLLNLLEEAYREIMKADVYVSCVNCRHIRNCVGDTSVYDKETWRHTLPVFPYCSFDGTGLCKFGTGDGGRPKSERPYYEEAKPIEGD